MQYVGYLWWREEKRHRDYCALNTTILFSFNEGDVVILMATVIPQSSAMMALLPSGVSFYVSVFKFICTYVGYAVYSKLHKIINVFFVLNTQQKITACWCIILRKTIKTWLSNANIMIDVQLMLYLLTNSLQASW